MPLLCGYRMPGVLCNPASRAARIALDIARQPPLRVGSATLANAHVGEVSDHGADHHDQKSTENGHAWSF